MATTSKNENPEASVNKVVASTIAASVASSVNMAVAPSVNNLAITTKIESESPLSDSFVSFKPQSFSLSGAGRDVVSYIAKEGDTVTTIAAQFGISTDTVKWANDLTSDRVDVGSSLDILPRNGVIYVVKNGDSVETIAAKYGSTASKVITFNDLELSGLTVGQKIIIPDGVLPSTERPGYVAVTAPSQSYATGLNPGFIGQTWRIRIGTPMYNGNAYYLGNCTAYVYDRRVELGLPVGSFWGNATTWDDAAVRAGLRVSNTPTVGAILQNEGGYGHVGIVEKILPNGDIEVSEMNAYVSGGGWNIVSGRIVPAAYVGQYAYIQ